MPATFKGKDIMAASAALGASQLCCHMVSPGSIIGSAWAVRWSSIARPTAFTSTSSRRTRAPTTWSLEVPPLGCPALSVASSQACIASSHSSKQASQAFCPERASSQPPCVALQLSFMLGARRCNGATATPAASSQAGPGPSGAPGKLCFVGARLAPHLLACTCCLARYARSGRSARSSRRLSR